MSSSEKKNKNKTKVPSVEEYLQQRDYLGALTLLEVLTIYLSGNQSYLDSWFNNDVNIC